MTKTSVEPLVGEHESVVTDTAPPIENLIDKESPRLGRIHERTNAIVDRMLNCDPQRFQELSKTQQSGQ
ncbi:MAG: hypothetical protein AMXMBFR84_35150 [Candidatus Hydrogenedentota bacterium]